MDKMEENIKEILTQHNQETKAQFAQITKQLEIVSTFLEWFSRPISEKIRTC